MDDRLDAGSDLFAWFIPRYFPRKPEDDYTYVIKNRKSRKKTVVVLPPGLPEYERKKIMNDAYRRIGIEPDGAQ
jgi:hypothetical protein